MAHPPPPSSRSPSLQSVASSTARSAKKAITSIKSAVKAVTKVLRPAKKSRTNVSSKASSFITDEGLPNDKTSTINVDASDEDGEDENDEEELKRLQKTWRSAAYGFFKAKVDVGYENGRKYHLFRCAATKCKSKGSVRRYQDSKDRAATSNLKSHAIKCFGRDAVDAAFNNTDAAPRDGSIFSAFARQGQQPVTTSHRAHTTDETRAHITRWCAESNRPMRIVEDCEFHTLMKAGRPGTSIPSRSTVSRDVKIAFEGCRQHIDRILREHNGHLHFSTDAWTSPNHCAFVAWTVHLHHQGQVLVFLLDIVEVPESHTGRALAQAFHQMLINHGLENKMLVLNADNASSNDTQTEHLDVLPNSFDIVNRVRCFNHTMQLSAKGLLRSFSGTGDEDLGGDELDTGEGNNESADLYNDDGDDDDGEAEDDAQTDDGNSDDEGDPFQDLDNDERRELLENTSAVHMTLNKIRKLSFAIVHSTTIGLPAWRDNCVHHKLRIRLIPRDVKTRWNSTYDMLKVSLEYCAVVDSVTADKALKLRKYELDDEDWKIIADLMRVLKIYKEATLFFSLNNIASIANVIPTMDRIDKMLKDSTANVTLTPSVRHALAFARKIIDKYYSKTDLSNIYRIAMVLHPQLKLKYFQQNGWSKAWVNIAEEIVRDEFAKYNVPALKSNAPPSNTLSLTDDNIDFFDIPMEGIAELHELDEYLSQPIEQVRDPVAWWWDHRSVYPKLSKMALDYLSIPATSTAVEHVFSQGRHLLHFTQNCLSPASIRAIMCFGDWSRKDLISTEDIVNAIVSCRKRKRVPSTKSTDED